MVCGQHPGKDPASWHKLCSLEVGSVMKRVTNEKPLHPQSQRLKLLSGIHTISLPLKFHRPDTGKEELALEATLLLDSWQSSVIHDGRSRWDLRSAL